MLVNEPSDPRSEGGSPVGGVATPSAPTRHRLGAVKEISPGEVMRIEVGGHAICVAHVKGGGFFAVDDRCTHEDIELSEGDLDGFEIECPAHGSRFDVRTGEVTGLPANVPTTTYRMGTEGDELYIEL